ncbi:MAG: metal ABC transporter permease [Alphaproteobacteria bacterium]|nr:metal ABC transporter permease [Alphaproteobacteria bacterium]
MLSTAEFLSIDLPAMLAGTLSCLGCGLIGNFLVLRRQALIGDAMSHVVLPGIVAGFLITGTVAVVPMVLGALAAGLIAAALINLIQRLGQLEPGAAMGVVFTTMFAAGVVMLEQSGAANVHLDVEHALYGSLEATLWIGPTDWPDLLQPVYWATLPREVATLAAVTTLIGVGVLAFYKELKITTFDPGLADSLGYSSRLIGWGLLLATAVAAVAAFEAVGSILVIAMFICPAATARMLTDRLARQLWISAGVAVISGIGGYAFAAFGPALWGSAQSLSAAGMIAVTAGLLQAAAVLFAPRYGVIPRWIRERRPVAAGPRPIS